MDYIESSEVRSYMQRLHSMRYDTVALIMRQAKPSDRCYIYQILKQHKRCADLIGDSAYLKSFFSLSSKYADAFDWDELLTKEIEIYDPFPGIDLGFIWKKVWTSYVQKEAKKLLLTQLTPEQRQVLQRLASTPLWEIDGSSMPDDIDKPRGTLLECLVKGDLPYMPLVLSELKASNESTPVAEHVINIQIFQTQIDLEILDLYMVEMGKLI